MIAGAVHCEMISGPLVIIRDLGPDSQMVNPRRCSLSRGGRGMLGSCERLQVWLVRAGSRGFGGGTFFLFFSLFFPPFCFVRSSKPHTSLSNRNFPEPGQTPLPALVGPATSRPRAPGQLPSIACPGRWLVPLWLLQSVASAAPVEPAAPAAPAARTHKPTKPEPLHRCALKRFASFIPGLQRAASIGHPPDATPERHPLGWEPCQSGHLELKGSSLPLEISPAALADVS